MGHYESAATAICGLDNVRPALPARTRILACVVLIGVTGCDQALTVPTSFPEPLIQPLALNVGVHYPPAFAEYTYKEAVPGDAAWSIRLGDANVAMFDSVLRRLFHNTVRLTAMPASGESIGLDAIIEPAVEAFEFSLPSQSATEQYSVWIRYNLNVYGPNSELITAWPVSAYGQSGSKTMHASRSMQEATILAMRDAAATISLGFPREPKISAALLLKELPDAKP